jgi:hypothetical protein
VYMQQLVRVVLLSWLLAGLVGMGRTRPANIQLTSTKLNNCCVYTLLPPDDGQLASPKHVEV